MVAHLWAHEQEESASGSNFFFEGTSIYSYGYHFEVGRIVKNKQGKKAYLINEDYYSATTSKHQCYVRNAIPTWAMVFSVGDNISDTGNMRFVASKLESIKKSNEKYKRAKEALELLGLDLERIKDTSPLTLSGGEKRKSAVAGILVCKPKYLIFDEPM